MDDVAQPGRQAEVEIMAGRRAFATAQALLAGGPLAGGAPQSLAVGWHDSSVDGEDGSFALVSTQNAALGDLVGEVASVTYGARVVFVYVLGAADVPVDVSLARRPFAALSRLTVESITALVQVVA